MWNVSPLVIKFTKSGLSQWFLSLLLNQAKFYRGLKKYWLSTIIDRTLIYEQLYLCDLFGNLNFPKANGYCKQERV